MEIKGHIVDVAGRKVTDGYLLVEEGRILGIRPTVVEPGAPFILPGLVDSHIHIESTLMTPEHYAALAVRKGTVAVVTDPHEIANVLGTEGVDFMIRNGRKVRFGFHFGAPPCVPSTCFETSGATLGPKEVEALLERDDIYGLCEMMNVPGVLFKDPDTMAKLEAAKRLGKPVDGHAPGLSGDELKKYVEAGVSTDHECSTLGEAREKIALGMKVIIREGSAACDFEQLWPVLLEHPEQVMFCSDDKYPDELVDGYLDDLVRRSVRHGVPVMDALLAACVNPVEHYGLRTGLLRPGDKADFITVDNLEDFNITATYIDGVKVYDAASGVSPDLVLDPTETAGLPNRFEAGLPEPEDLAVPFQEGRIKVITARSGSLLTGILEAEPAVKDGLIVPDTDRDILKIVVLNRYSHAAPAVGFISGFGLKKGALGSTIAHDSHNIVAIGTSDEEISKVVAELIRIKGGLVVSDGDKLKSLPLPVAGLMSPLSGVMAAGRLLELKSLAREAGCPFEAPFMTMAFMALPVIPELKITDKGLFEYRSFGFTELKA